MAGSLLGYLYPHIRGSQEDVATLALCYIVSQSKDLRDVFTKLLRDQLKINDNKVLNYSTQVVGENKERPDIVGIDSGGKEKIICEAKFYAGLTENQPNGYLDRLISIDNSGLIFICPESRRAGLWVQLKELVRYREVQEISADCLDVSGVHMSIITWGTILDELEKKAKHIEEDLSDDIKQLRGFYDEIESNAFVPFKPEDFGVDVARRIGRYNEVIDSATDLLEKRKDYNATLKGLRASPQVDGYTRYIKIKGCGVGLYVSRNLWKAQNSKATPFWLILDDIDENGHWYQGQRTKKYLNSLSPGETEMDSKGGGYIAIEITPGKTLQESAEEICNIVLKHIDNFCSFSNTGKH